jgi:flagellar M-ring protein FliF
MGLLGVLLVLFVLRPVARQVVVSLSEPKALPVVASAPALLPGAVAAEALDAGMTAEDAKREEAANIVVAEKVTEHIRRKPVQSSRLLENWIDGPQESA